MCGFGDFLGWFRRLRIVFLLDGAQVRRVLEVLDGDAQLLLVEVAALENHLALLLELLNLCHLALRQRGVWRRVRRLHAGEVSQLLRSDVRMDQVLTARQHDLLVHVVHE